MTEIPTTPDIDPDAPIAWRVSAMRPAPYASAHKPEVEESQCATREAADAYKRELQAQGYVASVAPVFLSPQARGKARAKTQASTAPKQFNRDWRLHGGNDGGGCP